jgi:hypothetical protein
MAPTPEPTAPTPEFSERIQELPGRIQEPNDPGSSAGLDPEVLRPDQPDLGAEVLRQQIVWINQTWTSLGQPLAGKWDLIAMAKFRSYSEEQRDKMADYLEWAVTSGRWSEPRYKPRFSSFINSGAGLHGKPIRTLPKLPARSTKAEMILDGIKRAGDKLRAMGYD